MKKCPHCGVETTDLKSSLGLVDEFEVAELRDMSLGSLRNERSLGRGPPFTRMGRSVFYPLAELKKFVADSTVTPKRSATLIHGSKRPRSKR